MKMVMKVKLRFFLLLVVSCSLVISLLTEHPLSRFFITDCTGEHESSDVAPGQPMTGPQHLLQQQPNVQAQPVPVTQVIQRLPYPRMVATIPSQHRQNDIRSNPDQYESNSRMTNGLSSVGNSSTNIQDPNATIVPAVVPQNRYATQSRVQPTSNTYAVSATSQLTHLRSDAIIIPSIVSNSTGNNQGTVMTCSQFHDFLTRILQNEQEYSQAMNKVYTVGPMQQIGPKIYFNIEKANKRHKQWHDIINTSPTSIALSSGSESKVTTKKSRILATLQRIFNFWTSPFHPLLCNHSNMNM